MWAKTQILWKLLALKAFLNSLLSLIKVWLQIMKPRSSALNPPSVRSAWNFCLTSSSEEFFRTFFMIMESSILKANRTTTQIIASIRTTKYHAVFASLWIWGLALLGTFDNWIVSIPCSWIEAFQGMSWAGLGGQGLGGWSFSPNVGRNHRPHYKRCSLGGKIKTEYTKLASLGDLGGQGLGW